jgi:antitoxin component YwqK of YwqJK toxin-antitoxin module
MKIIITEEQKKKLFIPRKLSGEDSRWADWNKDQPIKDGIRINQYDINTGKKEGIWEEYYSNGQLETKGLYKNNLRDGYWEEYYDNGQLWNKGSFKNGDRDGYWEEYWSNGQLYSKLSFKNGKEEGYWESYSKNGVIYFKGLYKDGKLDGILEFYNKDGNLIKKELWNNGRLVKRLPLTESEEQKKKLFIPRNIDDRKIEAEKIKQKYISEIKEIIEEEGSISMGELGGDSIMYGYATEYGDEIALIEGFYSDYVEVVVYGGYKYNTEETSFRAKYEELDLDIIMEIRKLLETYDAH